MTRQNPRVRELMAHLSERGEQRLSSPQARHAAETVARSAVGG